MATHVAPRYTNKTAPRCNVGDNTEIIKFTVPAGFATADIVNLLPIKPGMTILDTILSSDNLVGSTGNLKLGTEDDDDMFILQTAFTAAAIARLNNPVGHVYAPTVEKILRITAGTIAGLNVGTILTAQVRFSWNTPAAGV